MDNPILVEEYPREYGDTQFEKIKVTAKRAKDLHNAQKTPLVDSSRAAAYIALEEYNAGKIKTVYKQEEPPPMIARDTEDGEDEE
jgi:DNA-directed RNA polymerase subunit K/omega